MKERGKPTPSMTSSGAGQVAVSGPMTFASAGILLDLGKAQFAGRPSVGVDLSAVTDVDSAGLALLIEWLRQARGERRVLTFQGVPDKLLAIARLSGVEDLLKGS